MNKQTKKPRATRLVLLKAKARPSLRAHPYRGSTGGDASPNLETRTQIWRHFLLRARLLELLAEPNIDGTQAKSILKGLVAYRRFWSDRLRQVLGLSGLSKECTNSTMISDTGVLAAAAYSAFNIAAGSGDFSTLLQHSHTVWTQANHYLGANCNNDPHAEASYESACAIIGIQCPHPSCHTLGCSETFCHLCVPARNPPSLVKNGARVYTNKFAAWKAANAGKSEADFRGQAYQDVKTIPVTHENFWRYVRKNQNQVTLTSC